MDSAIVAIYVVCDDALKCLGIEDNRQAVMSTAEVVAFSIIAARVFSGNHKRARWTQIATFFVCHATPQRRWICTLLLANSAATIRFVPSSKPASTAP